MNSPLMAQHIIPWNTIVWDEDFTSPPQSQYILGQEAEILTGEGVLRLTPPAQGKSGRIYLPFRYELTFFDIRFDAWFGGKVGNGGGADGIVAVFAPFHNYPQSDGGDLNFTGCNGYGMEFDTYRNSEMNDLSGEHMALIKDSPANHLFSEQFSAGELEDEKWHSIRIHNTGGHFLMEFDQQPRFSYSIVDYPQFSGYFGFTAATATSFNAHKIDNILISVPARTKTSFGNISSCEAYSADTTIRIVNNDFDGLSLTIDSVLITPVSGTGTFAIQGIVPLTELQAGEHLDIAIRFNGQDLGRTRSLLTVFTNNGEYLVDTLDIALHLPRLTWSANTITLPSTHVRGFSDTSIYLINNSSVSANISGLTTTWHEYEVLSPSEFPLLIHPGDSVEVQLRFQPMAEGGRNGLLTVSGFCGNVDDVLLIGQSHVELVPFAFEERLMLRPHKNGIHHILLRSTISLSRVTELTLFIRYDPEVAGFESIHTTRSIIPTSATIEVSEDIPGNILVYILTESPIVEAGPLFGLKFGDKVGDFACGEIAIDTVILNQNSKMPGVPFSIGDTSSICINASCRVPGGIHKVVPPRMSIAPNPFTSSTMLTITAITDAHCRIHVIDESGNDVITIHDGFMQEGTHALKLNGRNLAKGFYFIVLTSGEHYQTEKVALQ